jgi:hemerythrin-like domain-containing protein
MQRAIRVLMDEHRIIEGVLGALKRHAALVRGGLSVERPTVARFATFFRDFADAAHHGKEEDILFRMMAESGFPTESGPIAVMLHEHVLGRGQVARLRGVGDGSGPVGDAERVEILGASEEYPPLLLAHIQKEDDILYPMSERLISVAGFERMAEAFERFTASLTGDRAPDRLLRLAEGLTADFPGGGPPPAAGAGRSQA